MNEIYIEDTEFSTEITNQQILDAENDLKLAWHNVYRIRLTPPPRMSDNASLPSDLLQPLKRGA